MNIIKLQKLKWKLIDGCETFVDSGISSAGNFLIKDLTDCDSAINYVYYVTRKIIVEKVISLDTKMFVMKKYASLVLKVVEIDGNDIQREVGSFNTIRYNSSIVDYCSRVWYLLSSFCYVFCPAVFSLGFEWSCDKKYQ